MYFRYFAILIASAAAVCAADIILPSPALERDARVRAIYRTGSLATGKGELSIRWTDAHGRVVEDRRIPVELTDENEVGFTLDLRRAAAMQNTLTAHFVFDGVNKRNAADHRDETATINFIARPTDRRWWDYTIMMWQNYPASAFPLLKEFGINGGQYVGKNRTPPEFLLRNDLRWYAENISTDFYSEYHRWMPDRPVNWAFVRAKEMHKENPASLEPFKRHPSLSDPQWLQTIRERLVDAAKRWSPYRPVFYSLGDESGVADLSAYWDFDFSDESLQEMRKWLREQYGSLAALNRQWGTNFTAWNFVVPDTTDQAMKRTGDNYSSWSDFKEWMDVAYTRALKMGNDAVRSVDPNAYVGIGGAQMPGWGGYDYARIAGSLTAVEPYDIGNNIEILRSINPRMAVVTTSFAHGPWEKHRVWYEFLHGNRGLIIWDDKNEFVTKDGNAGDRGREVQPYYTELRSGLGALFLATERLADPIAIHYSQASMRTEWMLAQRGKGTAWVNRNSSTERRDSEFMRLRESWCRVLEDQGLQYNFVSYNQVEAGELLKRGYRVLVLPHSTSLSAAEAEQIRAFAAQGGKVIADNEPGTFDEHSRRVEKPQLEGVGVRFHGDILNYHQNRLVSKEGPVRAEVGKLLGMEPEFRVIGDQVGVETHVFRNGGVKLVALLTNPQLRVDELGPPEFKSNDRFAKPRALKLALPADAYVYDVRAGKALGKVREVSFTMDPYEPSIFAVSPVPVPELQAFVPARVARGSNAEISIRFDRLPPAATQVVHVEVHDSSGKLLPHYSGNLLAHGGAVAKLLPVAMNDPAGKWDVRVRDVLSGQTVNVPVEVY